MLQRTLSAGFIAPCLPTKTDKLPSGSEWLHEIKHDGFRVIARKSGAQVRLYSRPGNDLTYRFPLIVETLARLRSRSCIIDGEAVACDDNGVALFNRVRYRRHDESIFLYAFDPSAGLGAGSKFCGRWPDKFGLIKLPSTQAYSDL
jgi:bifunctional non-homologous end joining protein LigD